MCDTFEVIDFSKLILRTIVFLLLKNKNKYYVRKFSRFKTSFHLNITLIMYNVHGMVSTVCWLTSQKNHLSYT